MSDIVETPAFFSSLQIADIHALCSVGQSGLKPAVSGIGAIPLIDLTPTCMDGPFLPFVVALGAAVQLPRSGHW
ncbi:MAG: hypothetical protein P8Q23_10955 [Paracoccaceae bacterium]|nr:hypothetical protein [Paracoccaceae bacterium]